MGPLPIALRTVRSTLAARSPGVVLAGIRGDPARRPYRACAALLASPDGFLILVNGCDLLT
ncbi:hypothetical protein [Micromonospora sp. NPDC092111]|uniref:hypothetical protein n=1 Tax=Micromonospora sp. NPDC092111 TaxID=3364289 RepID=UPI0038285ECE